MVELFDIVPFKSIEDIEKSPLPYFLASKEGLYLHKTTAIGNCLIPQPKMPEHLPSLGEYKEGYFHFAGPKVPEHIMAQAFDFFKKIYKDQKTEVEVFLLLNEETKEFKIFVPYQVVSGGSVNSIYEDSDIPKGFTIIGTIHSHCDFAAFHSGTDQNDAADFNGLHITIGHVNSPQPSFAAMIMINKLEFTYDINVVAEVGDLLADQASDKWFDFVYTDVDKLLNKVEFKTLSKEEIDKFEWECRPFNWNNNKKGKGKNAPVYTYESAWSDDDLVGRFYGTGGYLVATRWNEDFRRSIPSEDYVSSGYKAKLKPEAFRRELKREIEKLSELALQYDMLLDAEIYDEEQLETLNLRSWSDNRSAEDVDREDISLIGGYE